MAELYANGVMTTLASSMDNSQTTCSITSATGFPATGTFRCLIAAEGANTSEIVTVTARTTTTLTITRASEAYGGVQSASAHAAGAVIAIVLTAGAMPSVATDPIWTTAGKVARATGVGTATEQWPPGHQFDYAEITTPATFTATSTATANAVITGNATVFDGLTEVLIEVNIPAFFPVATATRIANIVLYDGSTELGRMAVVYNPVTASYSIPVYACRKLTPSAATHTYSIRCSNNASGTGTVGGENGAAGNYMPAFMRITKV